MRSAYEGQVSCRAVARAVRVCARARVCVCARARAHALPLSLLVPALLGLTIALQVVQLLAVHLLVASSGHESLLLLIRAGVIWLLGWLVTHLSACWPETCLACPGYGTTCSLQLNKQSCTGSRHRKGHSVQTQTDAYCCRPAA